MKKMDIVENISKRKELNLTKKQAKDIFNAIIEEIEEGLAKDKKIQITGFGTWKLNKIKARIGRNPRNINETMEIPERYQISFSAGSIFKHKVQEKNKIK